MIFDYVSKLFKEIYLLDEFKVLREKSIRRIVKSLLTRNEDACMYMVVK